MNSELNRANDFYKKSQGTSSISQSLRQGYLEKALFIYHGEIGKASQENLPSLWRNIGLASLNLAKVLDPKFDLKLIIYYLSEAVKNFTLAWMGRQEEEKTEWRNKIEELVYDCFQLTFGLIDGDVESQRIPHFLLLDNIEKSIDTVETLDNFRAWFHLLKGQYFYRCSVMSLEQSNFIVTGQLIEYCCQESQRALKYSKKCPEVAYEVKIFDEEVSFHRYSYESVRLRTQGDNLFAAYTNDTEEISFDMMWTALDKFKAAEMCCREIDVENEAMAVSRQGRLFGKVFMMKDRAKGYYRRAFDLAVAMVPRDFSNATWFQECKNALEAYQKENLAEETKRREKERQPYLLELKPELDKLNEIHQKSDPFKLLKHVYTTHPPKHGDNKYDEKLVNSQNVKKTILTAIIQYHPDKQVAFGMKWKVLSEEITKCLPARYECLKGV